MKPAFDRYAHNEYKDYVTYKELAKIESVPEFRRILEALAQHELEDFEYWKQYAAQKEFHMDVWSLFIIKLMRRFLGLTFTAKFLELNERRAVHDYAEILNSVDEKMRSRIKEIIDREKSHEMKFIGQIKEDQVKFMGSMILGLNDALIELTGALFGFSFVFHRPHLAAAAGLVTGLAGSLSMASSAYLQARYESDKDSKRAALYTGLSYFSVVLVLVAPFWFFRNVYAPLALMTALTLAVIAGASYYTAVIYERKFRRQFLEMTMASVGVAFIAAATGFIFRKLTGIET